MKLSQVYGGNYLKAEDLQGASPFVVIDSVEPKKFDDGTKLIITFKGKDKSLVCNSTNASIIEEVTGCDDTDNWIGARIQLTVRKVDFAGKRVPAIRVVAPGETVGSAAAPAPRQPEPERAPSPEDPDCPF